MKIVNGLLSAVGFANWPLLINVLKGELSFIGPTPLSPGAAEQLSPAEQPLLRVRPGIWGPADALFAENEVHLQQDKQTGARGNQRRQVELAYVKDRQLGKDLRLLLEIIRCRLSDLVKNQVSKGANGRNFMLPLDCMLVVLSYFLAYELRFDWLTPGPELRVFLKTLPLVLVLRIAAFYGSGLYRNLWKYTGVKDLMSILTACTISSVLMVATIFLFGFNTASRSIFLIDWMLCLLLVAGARLTLRLFNEKLSTPATFKKNVLIIGAGDVGEMLLRDLHKNRAHQYNVIGFLDDDETRHGLSIHGVRVLGDCKSVIELTPILRVDEVLITVAALTPGQMKRIIRHCKEAEVRHRIVPAVSDLLSGQLHLSKFRKVEVSDLFGRQPVELDLSAIASFLNGRRVLVTGAGGSIGSELCRQIAEYQPECLILVDKSENYLHEVRCELNSQFESLTTYCQLSDVTSEGKQQHIFERYRPQIVFHAAAHKHVPLSEENPVEAVTNNVFGTRIVADLASRFGVDYFVMVSTDKAVNPTNVMGTTKRVAELYIQALAQHSKTRFVTVRFGNVLNSNGSVIPIFMKQIEKGGPVTVTHQEVERYFMSISEAVQLILQAVTMGRSGEIFVLEMGKSIKIVEMAKELIRQAGFKPFEDIPIKFTGLRPGEKMFEELVGTHESSVRTSHSSIKTLKSSRVLAFEEIELALQKLAANLTDGDRGSLIGRLQEIVPEYTPDTEQNGRQNGHPRNGNIKTSFHSPDSRLTIYQ